MKFHFGQNRDCKAKQPGDLISTAYTLEEFRSACEMRPGMFCANCANWSSPDRPDSERYAELRKLVECWQKNLGQAYKDALIQWKHR